VRVAAALLALPLLLSLGAAASADDGRPARTVERATELPPRRATTERELVMLVGGLGSSASDATWEALKARYSGDPRYELRRFGADPRFPYDTLGPLEPNAVNLRDEVRALSPRYAAVHLVTHSMGGAVADRAFAQGLSAADGVRTYVALAAPHNGATAARIAQGALAQAQDEALEVRAAAAIAMHDPATAATRDLAVRRESRAIRDVTRLDLRLATDLLVLRRDSAVSGAPSRVLLPSSPGTLEGHGGVLRDPAVLDAVTATIATGMVPPDTRGELLREATGLVSNTADELSMVLLLAAALAAVLAASLLRSARGLRLVTRPLAERVLRIVP